MILFSPPTGGGGMSVPAIALLIGMGLIISAIIGGGFTVRDTTIPKLPPIPRVLCGVVGSLAVAFGLNILPLPAAGTTAQRTSYCSNLPPNSVPATTPGVEISDQLGEQQEFERVDLSIGGRLVGTLCVEGGSEGSERRVIRVPLTGREEAWTATGSEARTLRRGRRVRTIQGSGTINLRESGSYSVRIVADGSTDVVQTIWLRRN